MNEYSQDNTVDPGFLWEMVKMKVREVLKCGTTKKRNIRKELEEIEISITTLEKLMSMTNKRNKCGAILKEKDVS